MRGYRKADVDLHSDGFAQRGQPAVNVKAQYDFDVGRVQARFGCSEATAEKAADFAEEAASEGFWKYSAPEIAKHFFGPCCVYSEGRSDGWLVLAPKLEGSRVTNRPLLPPVEEWDGVMLNKWALFERAIRAEVDYLSGWQSVAALIEVNDWAVDQTAIEGMVAAALA